MSIITDKALTASDVGQQIFAAVELFTEAFREDENNGTLVKLLVNAQDSDDWDFVSGSSSLVRRKILTEAVGRKGWHCVGFRRLQQSSR